MNKLSIDYQSYSKSRKIDAFKQNICICQNPTTHRVIILNRGSCLAREREESDANFPEQNVQRHRVTSLETACSLANGPSLRRGPGAEGEVCILRSPWIAVSPISLLSVGGVYERSLTAGKIFFSGNQTCSLYLVL